MMGAWGTHPFSIVRSTRGGRVHFLATWFPTSETRRFETKGEATRWIKGMERGR